MKIYQEDALAEDGLLLNYYRWVPDNPKAAIVIAHGWNEHAGRYDALAKWFASKGFEVHALDHRGHGQSAGKRGHVDNWTDYTRDLEQLRRSVDHETQYLLGHSMGGMIGIVHLLEYPDVFSAAALSGPAADLSLEVPKSKFWVSKALNKVWPTLTLKNDIDPYSVCSDQGIVENYINDPYNHGCVSVSWFMNYLSVIERVKSEANNIATPVAIWHGSEDELVCPWVSEQFFKRLSASNSERHVVKGGFHEILYEPNWQQTANEINGWWQRHLL